ncbi:MAG TPA: biotin/lipoyl-containing protein [Gemmataceae bacterium]|nr:biotin/lipoyl-containing protein [Gemmataceae bacterium]
MAANEPAGAGPAHDVTTIRQLAEIMSQHDLSEIHWAQGERRLLLRRGAKSVVAPAPVAQLAPAAAQPVKTDSSAGKRKLLEIKSEAIGIFYSRPKPEMDPYVKIGTRVTPDTPVGQIEAMKIFNEILAGCSGVVAEICVENQQPVEFGTVLFRVDPS